MTETFAIAGYARISVDDELDRDNTSIENQKAIIAEFVKTKFPGSALTFYEDRDRSGYTFEQREGYQAMRRELVSRRKDILVIKDFSRFSRRNSRGLVELEDLRDAGVRIISIGDGVDFPNDDDWLKIQFQFLINEMPVTDTSKKVKNVIKRRQADGQWICAAPYGYIVNKRKEFEIVPTDADIVRKIFDLYNNEGWGYKRIANYLTQQGIPTPRMSEQLRRESQGESYGRAVKAAWSIVSIQGILDNDFYIGTLRQGKYTRAKINGKDVKRDEGEHIVIENHHQPIIDYRTFAITRALRAKRTRSNYRGIKKYDNAYSGFLTCGDCGAPMFAMSRSDLKPAYTCGTYHRRGLAGCTSHHIRVDKLDELIKLYVRRVMDNSAAMLAQLNAGLARETEDVAQTEQSAANLAQVLSQLHEELKATKRQRIRDVMRHPDQEALLDATYDELESDLQRKIEGLGRQIDMLSDKRNTILRVNRAAKTAMDVFRDILDKQKLERNDLELMIDRIRVFEDHLEIRLQADIDALLRSSAAEEAVNFKPGIKDSLPSRIVQSAAHQKDKVFDVHVISDGDPLEIYTDRDGEVILKKYSPIGEMSAFAKDYTESIFRAMGHIACIVDRDQVVAASGVSKKELADKPISHDLETAIANRQTVAINRAGGGKIVAVTNEEDITGYTAQVVSPIIADGEAIGAVLLLSKEQGAKMGDAELKVAETAASIVGRQMEQ
ncbi:MAG: stage V sporulation T C-terminal domain-containing protein [Eubacteriales bacterium]|nr:stage V sporulation T C-terminal domain-containing protein [Eubacteriales bacterium]